MASSVPGSANLANDLDQENAQDSSMDEILASIKQIIADDETVEDGTTERERYTHPSDHSNSNLSGPAVDIGNAAIPPVESPIQEHAAQLRHASSYIDPGLNAEERLAKYRIGGKLKMETLAEQVSESKSPPIPVNRPAPIPAVDPNPIPVVRATPSPAPIPVAGPAPSPLYHANPIPVLGVAPAAAAPIPAPTPASPTPSTKAVAQEMAAVLMAEKSADLEILLSDLMRPTIRQWLSDNLPSLVERLVREEIEAVSRGKRVS